MNQCKEMMKITPRRRSKTQILIICVSLIILVFVIYQILSNSNMIWLNRSTVSDKNGESHANLGEVSLLNTKDYLMHKPHHSFQQPFTGEKLIHLDLKGAPPLVSFLKEFFPYIKKLGATGILIEYEDMFPYREELEEIKALNAYKPSDIRTILELAEMQNLTVIPLLQTFGHFEFVLKLEKFKELREINRYPQVLCPTHEKINFYIQKMIDQVLEAHPKANYVHIGCDEVLYLGKCDRCTNVMSENNWNANNLFLNHVRNIALYINKTYPGVRPIMWGDMIDKNAEKLVEKYEISSLVDLMIWKYVPNVSKYITSELLDVYARLFKQIWIASAFKGATGANQIVTNARYHLENHIAWMNIVANWNQLINFKGIALTGWQRYDHFSVLCELLPVAIPSLTLSLHFLSEKGAYPNVILNILQCDSAIPFSPEEINYLGISKCNFPGFVVFQLINRLFSLSSKMESRLSNMASGWFSAYNIANKFSSPAYVTEIFNSWPVDEYRIEINLLERELRKALSEIYDEHTVGEWITTHLTPLRIRLDAYFNAKEALLEQNVWPRRPLMVNSDALEKSAGEICNSDRKSGCGLLLF